MLCFLPGDALLVLYCSHFKLLLVCGCLCLQFCLQQLKSMLCWTETDLAMKNILFLSLEKLSQYGLEFIQRCEELSDYFCSVRLNLGRECRFVHFIYPAASQHQLDAIKCLFFLIIRYVSNFDMIYFSCLL